jgi:hypothetical protein
MTNAMIDTLVDKVQGTGRQLILYFIIPAFLFGCKDTQNLKDESMVDVQKRLPTETKQALNTLKDSRILFAHKSVGSSVISGIKKLSDEAGISLNIQAVDNKPLSEGDMFAHTSGGENEKPKTKVDSFSSKLKGMKKDQLPEIAFMKFCFVDIKPDTDVRELFDYYKKNIDELKREIPEVTFVHLTVPLHERSTSLKHKIKHLLGMDVWHEVTNIKRNEINELILETFKDEPVFDIARFEATRSDGGFEEFTENGKSYLSLASEYTSDGGHLNKKGQIYVANEMVNFLAKTIEQNQNKAK